MSADPRGSVIVAAVQMCSGVDKDANVAAMSEAIAEATTAGARFVATPEYCTYLGPDTGFEAIAEPVPGATTDAIGELARRHGIYVLIGSMVERDDEGRLFNTSVLIGPDAGVVARYRKIHLFQAGHEAAAGAEGRLITGGDRVVVAAVDDWRVGLSVCYDVRFPELYRRLADDGADLLAVPSAFTMFTGRDHWEVLLRSRAIENQAFLIAPAQIGRFEGGESYGRSCIIDPWGVPLAVAGDRQRLVTAQCDLSAMDAIRSQFPVRASRRFAVTGPTGSPANASATPSNLSAR